MDTDSFIFHVKTKDVYKDITEDVEKQIWCFKFWDRQTIAKGKNKKVIGLMKDELGGKSMNKFVVLKAEKYSYLKTIMNIKKEKGIKKKT